MILSIQYMRAMAALMVVAFHIAMKLSLHDETKSYTTIGASGVDIFFVISGFVMFLTTKDRGVSASQFIIKRIIRIVPLYYFVTTTALLVMIVLPKMAYTTRISPTHLLASYAFVPYPNPSQPTRLWPFVIPGWTLNYEIFFYVLVAFTLFMANRSLRLIVLSIIIVGLSALGLWKKQTSVIGIFYLSPILLEFLAGYWLCYAYQRIRAPQTFCVILVLSAFIYYTLFGVAGDLQDWPRILRWGLPSFMLTAGVLFLDREIRLRPIGVLVLLGNASYSIYLAQFLVVSAYTTLWHSLHIPLAAGLTSDVIFIVGGTAMVSVSGILLHYMLERPVTKWLHSKTFAQPRWVTRKAAVSKQEAAA